MNIDVICQYWQIGRSILEQQELHGWGAKVIDRISHDLREAFPNAKGFSPRNLRYMRRFAKTWPDFELVQRVVALIPWGDNIELMQKLDDQERREWYARQAIENGWGRDALVAQIRSKAWERSGKAVNDFGRALPAPDSDLAAQVFKDPYWFDFMGTAQLRREREVDQKLIEHIQEFLIEPGQGFAFVGRQVHLELGGDDYYLDLLFYHLKLRCFVVIELKACDFEPGFLGQLNMYQNVVNEVLRHPDDKPTIGLLLVKGKDETTVRYSLEGYVNPIGVAEWEQQIAGALPEEVRSSLPTIEDLERELGGGDAQSSAMEPEALPRAVLFQTAQRGGGRAKVTDCDLGANVGESAHMVPLHTPRGRGTGERPPSAARSDLAKTRRQRRPLPRPRR